MKTAKGQLGSYQMMIASKYFETIGDLIAKKSHWKYGKISF